MKKKAQVFLWTGNGWGKTTSGLGVAMRCLGHKYKVVIVQFMKGWKNTGEYKFLSKQKNIDIKQFGRKGWVNLKKPSEEDKKLARKGLEYAALKAKEKPFLLFLDEINIAISVGLLQEKEVLEFLDSVPSSVHVYMTGRYATPAMKRRADFVNEIKWIKGVRKEGEKGIDY